MSSWFVFDHTSRGTTEDHRAGLIGSYECSCSPARPQQWLPLRSQQLIGALPREHPHVPAVVGSRSLLAMAGGFFVYTLPSSGWSEQEMRTLRMIAAMRASRSHGDSEAVCTAWTATYLEALMADPLPGIPGAWFYGQAVREPVRARAMAVTWLLVQSRILARTLAMSLAVTIPSSRRSQLTLSRPTGTRQGSSFNVKHRLSI